MSMAIAGLSYSTLHSTAETRETSPPNAMHPCTTTPQADYAEERLDAHHEFQEELDEALRIRKMVDTGLHDTALERLMSSTEVRKNTPRQRATGRTRGNIPFNVWSTTGCSIVRVLHCLYVKVTKWTLLTPISYARVDFNCTSVCARCLPASTRLHSAPHCGRRQGQMYHHFHKHRYELEQTGEWSFVPPSIKRKWRHADKQSDKVEKLRKYMAARRDRFLRIRYDVTPEQARCDLRLQVC